jgi:hypothetical protein
MIPTGRSDVEICYEFGKCPDGLWRAAVQVEGRNKRSGEMVAEDTGLPSEVGPDLPGYETADDSIRAALTGLADWIETTMLPGLARPVQAHIQEVCGG